MMMTYVTLLENLCTKKKVCYVLSFLREECTVLSIIISYTTEGHFFLIKKKSSMSTAINDTFCQMSFD